MKISKEWNEEDSSYIKKKVIEHNMKMLEDEAKSPLDQVSFMLRDDDGQLLGGITGEAFWYHMHIDFLWVDESLRGQGYGKQLLHQLEEYAQENNYYLILLDSFSFQAPQFYKNHGYKEFGKVEDHPRGHSRSYLMKRL